MAKQPTLQDRICCALLQRGNREVIPSRSRKYRQFTTFDQNKNEVTALFYWIGKMGAMRVGRVPSKTMRKSDSVVERLLRDHPMNPVVQPTRADIDEGTKPFICVRCTCPITTDQRGPGILIYKVGPVHNIHATRAEIDAHLASDKPLWKPKEGHAKETKLHGD